MGLEKSEIKIGTIKGIGSRLEDQAEAAQKELASMEGALVSLKAAVKKIEALFAHVDTDIEEEKVPEDVLAVAKYAKTYVRRAADVVGNMAVAAEVGGHRLRGKLEGLQASVKTTKKELDSEVAKVEAIANALESGTLSIEDSDELPERPTGVHPGNPIAARRAAEEAADVKSLGREALMALAEKHEIKVDGRWSDTRLRRALEESMNGEDA